MKEYIDCLEFEIETAKECFEHFNAKPIFNYRVIENPYGGNPTLHVTFTYETKQFNGKIKEWKINPAFCSVEMFRNEIKSYMYDCLYCFISILF